MEYEPLAIGTVRRLNLYLRYLSELPRDAVLINPRSMAETLALNPQLVRQDMKELLKKERVGSENRDVMLAAIGKHIELHRVTTVVLVGAGKLGSALMSYAGFSVYGLDILAGFDINEKIIKKGAYGKPVYPIERLTEICHRLNANIAIITTPGGCAQITCDALVASGVSAIWNFTSVRLKVMPHVMVRNEDMSASLRLLARHAANN